MLVILTTGQFPILRCDECGVVFTGPMAGQYAQAHQISHKEESHD